MLLIRKLSVVLVLYLGLISVSHAQVDLQTALPPPPPIEAIDITGLTSPRETVTTFLDAMDAVKRDHSKRITDAIRTFDLSSVNALVRKEKGRDLAWILSEILALTKGINLKKIPARNVKKPYVVRKFDSGSIVLSKTDDGRWLFDAKTVKALADILDELVNRPTADGEPDQSSQLPWYLRFRADLPDGLKEKVFLLEHWQWIGILLVIAIGITIDKLVAFLLQLAVRRWRSGGITLEFWLISDDWLRPLGMVVMAAVWWLGLNLLGLPANTLVVLLVAVKLLLGLSGIWSGLRIVDFICAFLQRHARKTVTKVDDILVPLVRKTLKVFVTVIGILFVASGLNLNLTGLMAGLGLGGLAFALASKDLVQNLFGSLTVLLDQSFHVGDWVVIGDVEGSVEEVGLRSTRIRTFYNSVITMPNSRLITASVDNMGVRRFRRMKSKVSLTHNTPPEQVEAFCEAVRELVRLHPYMRKDYFHVYLNDLSADALEILLYVFWETPDWSTELREKHRFLLDVLRVGDSLGIEFAFPTQTIYVKSTEVEAESSRKKVAPIDQETIFNQARDAAKKVVEKSTGLDVKPPPVSFDQEPY